MTAEAFQFERETWGEWKIGENLAKIAFLPNAARPRLRSRFERSDIQRSAKRVPRTEYRSGCHGDERLFMHGVLRQEVPIVKGGINKRERISRNSYKLETGADTTRRWMKRHQALKPIWRKRFPRKYNQLPPYLQVQTAFSPPPTAPGDALHGTERERSEFCWLALNQQQYAGRWVALNGSRLLAVGDSAREVYAAIAKRKGTPLVTRVEGENEAYFAGW